MMMITITDKIGDNGSITVEKDEAAETIRPWFPGMPAEVAEVIDSLQTALNRDDRADRSELEAYLGIEIRHSK